MTYLAFVVLCIVVHVLHISQFDLTTRQWRANISLVQKTTITFKNGTKVYYKPYLSHMISKKNPSIPEFIEEKNADMFTLLEFFQYIYFGQTIRFNPDTCIQF